MKSPIYHLTNVPGTEFTLGTIVAMPVTGKLTMIFKQVSKKSIFKNKNFKENFLWIPAVLRVLYIYEIQKSMGIPYKGNQYYSISQFKTRFRAHM